MVNDVNLRTKIVLINRKLFHQIFMLTHMYFFITVLKTTKNILKNSIKIIYT
jgi:hypothetical protein